MATPRLMEKRNKEAIKKLLDEIQRIRTLGSIQKSKVEKYLSSFNDTLEIGLDMSFTFSMLNYVCHPKADIPVPTSKNDVKRLSLWHFTLMLDTDLDQWTHFEKKIFQFITQDDLLLESYSDPYDALCQIFRKQIQAHPKKNIFGALIKLLADKDDKFIATLALDLSNAGISNNSVTSVGRFLLKMDRSYLIKTANRNGAIYNVLDIIAVEEPEFLQRKYASFKKQALKSESQTLPRLVNSLIIADKEAYKSEVIALAQKANNGYDLYKIAFLLQKHYGKELDELILSLANKSLSSKSLTGDQIIDDEFLVDPNKRYILKDPREMVVDWLNLHYPLEGSKAKKKYKLK